MRILCTCLRRPARFSGIELEAVDSVLGLKIPQSGGPPGCCFWVGEVDVGCITFDTIPPLGVHTSLFVLHEIAAINQTFYNAIVLKNHICIDDKNNSNNSKDLIVNWKDLLYVHYVGYDYSYFYKITYPFWSASVYQGSQPLLMKGCTQTVILNPIAFKLSLSFLRSGNFLVSTLNEP